MPFVYIAFVCCVIIHPLNLQINISLFGFKAAALATALTTWIYLFIVLFYIKKK